MKPPRGKDPALARQRVGPPASECNALRVLQEAALSGPQPPVHAVQPCEPRPASKKTRLADANAAKVEGVGGKELKLNPEKAVAAEEELSEPKLAFGGAGMPIVPRLHLSSQSSMSQGRAGRLPALQPRPFVSKSAADLVSVEALDRLEHDHMMKREQRMRIADKRRQLQKLSHPPPVVQQTQLSRVLEPAVVHRHIHHHVYHYDYPSEDGQPSHQVLSQVSSMPSLGTMGAAFGPSKASPVIASQQIRRGSGASMVPKRLVPLATGWVNDISDQAETPRRVSVHS